MARKKRTPKIITLDTETYNGLIGDLKRIAIYDGQKVHYGYSFSDIEPVLLNYVSMDFDVHIYIHNAEFDLRKIPEIFEQGNIVWKQSLIINGKIAKIQTKNYTIHDSFKLLPMSLKKLSKGFNVEHGKLDLFEAVEETYPGKYSVYKDNGKIDKNKTLVNFLDKCDIDDPLFLEYLGYDVISLYEVLQVLMNISGLSVSDFVGRVSTASLSRFLFKHGYRGKQFIHEGETKTDYEMLSLYNWNKNLDVENFIRESYCGGRTEVFTPRLDSPGYHYDVNSLYPSVMMGQEYPIGKPYFSDSPEIAAHYYKTWKTDRHGLGFINAQVYIPDQFIPPLPVKMGKLTFPCGYVYGVWTYEELEYAEKNCGVEVIQYYAVCHFEKTFKVFDNFVTEFYKLKEQGTREKNEPLRTLAKLILNVGYGYTGMRRDDKTQLDDFKNRDKHDNITYFDEKIGYIEYPAEIKSEYIQVQIASYVTSRARLVLLRGLRDIVNRGGTVYYCDTDSIVSSIPMHPDMVDSEKLGLWDLEKEPSKGLFLRPKVYTELTLEGTNIKFKGISKETQETLDYEFYEKLYGKLIDGTEDYEIVEKNKLMLRSIMYMEKKGLNHNYYETRDKKMNFKTVEKRNINYAENYTKPHYFATINDFETFTFKPVKQEVPFDMSRRF